MLGFVLVGVLAFGSVTAKPGGPNGGALWGAFHFLSVGLAVGAAWLISVLAPSFPGWPLGAFMATTAYLLVTGAENTVANRQRDS